MKCPHCLQGFHDRPRITFLTDDVEGRWAIEHRLCPTCGKLIIFLINGPVPQKQSRALFTSINKRILVYPRTTIRSPVPCEVPKKFAEDYMEACLVLPDSPKASAALSRRCLQYLLRDVAKVRPQNLVDEIQEVIDSGKLPSHLVESVDAIRNIGNFATHPVKSQKTGEIVPVEPGEAEWNLDVLESLFDFYFVQPEILKKKRQALNKKLKEAGKKEMK